MRTQPIPLLCAALILLAPTWLFAQKSQKQIDLRKYNESARATVIHEAIVYVETDENSAHVTTVEPGREMVIMEKNGPWIRVFANTDTEKLPDDAPEFGQQEYYPSSGWIKDKGVIGPATPLGDTLLYGAAASMELLASEPHAPKDSASSARWLYMRLIEMFPQSTYAAPSAFRAADIKWQLEKLDNSTLPSAHEQEAYMRPQIHDDQMKKVIKLYPNTKYAALAAYDLLDNQVCGDWAGLAKCPEMETVLYIKYAEHYPDSPRTAEALYNAVYRQASAADIYRENGDKKKADAAAAWADSIEKGLMKQFPQTDFAARAAALVYRLQQSVPVYGTDRD
jgi:hypothetical protein